MPACIFGSAGIQADLTWPGTSSAANEVSVYAGGGGGSWRRRPAHARYSHQKARQTTGAALIRGGALILGEALFQGNAEYPAS